MWRLINKQWVLFKHSKLKWERAPKKLSFLKELCSKSANCSRTFPKTGLSVTNSLVYEAVARRFTNSLMTKWSMSGVSLKRWVVGPKACALQTAEGKEFFYWFQLTKSVWIFFFGVHTPKRWVAHRAVRSRLPNEKKWTPTCPCAAASAVATEVSFSSTATRIAKHTTKHTTKHPAIHTAVTATGSFLSLQRTLQHTVQHTAQHTAQRTVQHTCGYNCRQLL